MKHVLFAILGVLLLTANTRAQWPSAEHLIYIRIETEPAAATISTIPSKEGASPVVLGKSPLVIPIELNWGRSYLRKSWEKIQVATRSGIATNNFDPTDKTHSIGISFAIAKDGYMPQEIHQLGAVLQYNDRAIDWDHAIEALPENRTLIFTLEPLQSSTSDSGAPASAPLAQATTSNAISTVIFAHGAKTDASKLGYALVTTPHGAPVLVDGKPVGNAPVRVMLSEGNHIISTLNDGKLVLERTVAIKAGDTTSLSLDGSSK